jgi:hypothetical protein
MIDLSTTFFGVSGLRLVILQALPVVGGLVLGSGALVGAA